MKHLNKEISFIVAIAQNNAIGCENKLLWHIPNDLKRFKRLTMDHTVVMGMNTWESLPFKPLPGRRNIIMTHRNIELPGCEIAHSLNEAMSMLDGDKENFIIGGAQIFEAFLPYATRLILTIVHKDFYADTFFPEIDFSNWKETEREDITDTGDLGFDYSYITYIRN
ncbi:MAG TPA: dihydrofolate reductase [Lentimicrobium sp.]|nr:dihydrofolate reductase [Lentimicrobium sp.]